MRPHRSIISRLLGCCIRCIRCIGGLHCLRRLSALARPEAWRLGRLARLGRLIRLGRLGRALRLRRQHCLGRLLAAGAAIVAIAAIALVTALTTRAALALLALCGVAGAATAQSSPAFGPLAGANVMPSTATADKPARAVDTMPLSDYLGLLRQISPAAELGTRDYLAAFLLRCGREATTPELHRSLSGTPGDAVLMAYVRAAQRQDAGTRQQLAHQLQCPSGAAR